MARSPENIERRKQRQVKNRTSRVTSYNLQGIFTRDDLVAKGWRAKERNCGVVSDQNSASNVLNKLVDADVLECDHVMGGNRQYWWPSEAPPEPIKTTSQKTYLKDLPDFPEHLVMVPPEQLDYDIVWQDMTE